MFRGQITFFPVVFGVKSPFPYVFCMFLYVFICFCCCGCWFPKALEPFPCHLRSGVCRCWGAQERRQKTAVIFYPNGNFNKNWLVVWNLFGNNNPNWRTHIFQRDWNHQPEKFDNKKCVCVLCLLLLVLWILLTEWRFELTMFVILLAVVLTVFFCYMSVKNADDFMIFEHLQTPSRISCLVFHAVVPTMNKWEGMGGWG